MIADFRDWLLHPSGAGVAWRVVAIVAVLAGLAAWDYRRKGPQARRWREYLFLAAAVMAAIAYGVVNDQITSSLSWEYYYHGKGLAAELGFQRPPAPLRLHWLAARTGVEATWAAGLIFGALVLLAASAGKDRPPIPPRTLYRLLPIPLLAAGLAGTVLGLAGYFGLLEHFSRDLRIIGESYGLEHPRAFMAVEGVHLGGYIGAALGGAWAVWYVLRLRSPRTNRPS